VTPVERRAMEQLAIACGLDGAAVDAALAEVSALLDT
jgi:hypothetical protein